MICYGKDKKNLSFPFFFCLNIGVFMVITLYGGEVFYG